MFLKNDYQGKWVNGTLGMVTGIDDDEIRVNLLRNYNIEIGGGLGPFAGKVWRIGLMGYSAREENVSELLNALKKII